MRKVIDIIVTSNFTIVKWSLWQTTFYRNVIEGSGLFHSIQYQRIHQIHKHNYFVRKGRAIIVTSNFTIVKWSLWQTTFYRNVIEGCCLFHSIQYQKIHQIHKHNYFVRKGRAIIVTSNFTIVKWSLWQTTFYRNVIEGCCLFHSIQYQKIHQIHKHNYFVRKGRAIIVTSNFTIVKWSLWQTTFYRNVIEGCCLFHSIQYQKIHQIHKHNYFVRKGRAIIVTSNFTIVKWSLWQTTFYRNVIEGCCLFHSIQYQKIHQIYKHNYFVRKVRAIIVTSNFTIVKWSLWQTNFYRNVIEGSGLFH